jgi:hypothetical protein
MPFKKGMKKTKGFTGKKHSEYSRWLMSEGRKIGWKRRKLNELALNQESL